MVMRANRASSSTRQAGRYTESIYNGPLLFACVWMNVCVWAHIQFPISKQTVGVKNIGDWWSCLFYSADDKYNNIVHTYLWRQVYMHNSNSKHKRYDVKYTKIKISYPRCGIRHRVSKVLDPVNCSIDLLLLESVSLIWLDKWLFKVWTFRIAR